MNKKKILIFYIIIAFFWIFGTNYILDQFDPSPVVAIITSVKELFYILMTGLLFYYFIKKTEELHASREEEKRLSTLINTMVDAVCFKDGEGRWIEANESGLKMLGLDHINYNGKTNAELSKFAPAYKNALSMFTESDEITWKNKTITRFEENFPTEDGALKIFDTIKVPLYYQDGNRRGLVIISRDITDRKNMEMQLEESKQHYKSLFEYNTGIIFMTDLSGHITNVNPQFSEITGFSEEDAIGKKVTAFFAAYFQNTVIQYVSEVVQNHQPKVKEMKLIHKDGSKLTIEGMILPIVVNDEAKGIIIHGKDVTKLRLAEERLRKTEKLSVVGEMSASIAHEIRNPLTSLKGFVQLLETEDEKHQFYYRIMQDELDRINHIVSELLLLAKPQEVKFEYADLQKLLYSVISLLKTEALLHNVDIDFRRLPQELEVECEPNQLKQLFINIIKNAVEATAPKGNVVVSVSSTETIVTVTVIDDGCGISEEGLKRIGEPFYSSKEKGTGLGLTVSSKIVQSHNGTMTFSSRKDEGTKVTIELPVRRNNEQRS